MSLQLDVRKPGLALAYDEEATLVADRLELPIEAYGPTSDQPTVLLKANPILDFDALLELPDAAPWKDAPTLTAPAPAPRTGSGLTPAPRSVSAARPATAPMPAATKSIVVGIWTATFLVLSVLGYLVSSAHAQSDAGAPEAAAHVAR